MCKIDGERSIADLARECGFTLFEAGTVVRVLVEAGLVDVEEDVGPDGAPVNEEDEPEAASAPATKGRRRRPAADQPSGSGSTAGSTGGNYPRTAALAAAFALSGRDSGRARAQPRTARMPLPLNP